YQGRECGCRYRSESVRGRGPQPGARYTGSVQRPWTAGTGERLAENLSFMPEKTAEKLAMVGSQALTFGSDMMDAFSSVAMDDGSKVDKGLIVSRLDVVGSDIADLGAAYTVLSNNFVQKDNGIYRIVQDAADFKRLCEKFYNSRPGAHRAKGALETFLRKA